MPSLKLSVTGVEIVKQARKEKAWTIDDPRWLEAVSQILKPECSWENAEVFVAGVSLPTWKRFLRGDGIDASVFKAFCQVLGLNWQELIDRPFKSPSSSTTQIPDIPLFFGRDYELATLIKSVEDGTRLLVITGIGGIGKTAIATKLAAALQPQFKQTLWFSVHLTSLSTHTPKALESQTLMVFDGWDEILRAGQYPLGAEFLRTVVQTTHNSCVILTSREQPEGLNILSAAGAVIFPLGGLMEGAIELLQHHRLTFNAQQWVALVNQYGGNPLFLNMAANFIHELFAGDVGEFLACGTIVAGEFEPLVSEWLKYISPVEKILIKFLTTSIQGFTREEILLNLASDATNGDILKALLSLKRRGLVETIKDGEKERFFLQLVIFKCVRRLFNE
ncbi:ATP-binding protein [Nostoc sp. PCC 7107]|uniref:ATP-binding protein n=1 Tax=Nostoc sp. PCC 7107 TaxID=317936 RepID=UPI00029EDA26|nr:ATP-binding protein [Nostoc sp. PCC 7107]AFY42517.1 hypothetical protein Nos7107_1886 [Nostoc sp. PCC 7107]